MSDPFICLGDCETSIPYCVNIETPQGFGFDQKNPFNICVQSSTVGLWCSVVPCSFTQTVQVPDPCNTGEFISCLGEISVNKVVVAGDIALLFNADVFAGDGFNENTDVGDCAVTSNVDPSGIELNTPGNPSVPITVSRFVSVPVRQTVCVSCSIDSCPTNLVSSVTIDNMTKVTTECTTLGFDIISIKGTINFTTC